MESGFTEELAKEMIYQWGVSWKNIDDLWTELMDTKDKLEHLIQNFKEHQHIRGQLVKKI